MKIVLTCILSQLQNKALFDEILSVHEQKVRCASVHLFSGVHSVFLLDIWLRKYSELIYFIFFLTLKGSVPNSMRISGARILHCYRYDSWKIFGSQVHHTLSSFNTLPHPFLGVHYHLRQKISSLQLPNSAVWHTTRYRKFDSEKTSDTQTNRF